MRSRSTFPLVALVAILAALIVPATAPAKSRSATYKNVVTHVKKARVALAKFRATESPRFVATATREANAAARGARVLDRRGARVASEAAGALSLVGGQFDANLETFVAALDEVFDSVKDDVAAGIQAALAGRQLTLGAISGIIGQIPVSQQDDVAGVATGVIADDPATIGSLFDILGSGTLPVDVAAIIGDVVAVCTEALKTGLSAVADILGELPARIASTISGVLDTVVPAITGLIERIPTLLGNLTGGTPAGSGAGGFGGLLSGPLGAVTGILDSVLGDFGGMFGGFLGGGGLFGSR